MNVYREVETATAVNPDLMAEAERWLSRLGGGQGSSAERRAFEQWLAHPSHAAAYAEADRFWRIFDDASTDPEAEALIARTLADTAGRAPQRQGTRRWLALAASVVVCAIGFATFRVGQHHAPAKTYATEFGQRSIVQLDDGSQLALNSATRVSVRIASDSRQFKVLEGEAVFTVARDPARPFTVEAGDGEVTALGTRFQVRKDSKQVIVTLLEGRIVVDREDSRQHVQLAPGDQVSFGEGSADMTRRTVDPEVASSWTTGKLKFKATPLSEVLEEVNRYTRAQIRLADPSLGSMPVNAAVEIGNSAAVVAALESLLPVEAQYLARHQIVLRKN